MLPASGTMSIRVLAASLSPFTGNTTLSIRYRFRPGKLLRSLVLNRGLILSSRYTISHRSHHSRFTSMISTLLTAALAATTALFGLANAAATPRLGGQNFPDPSVIRADDGWRAYATEVTVDGKKVYVPMAYTRDWKTWTFRGQKDAMPKLAPWINKAHPRVWAPDIVALPGGKYILYYSAALQSNGAIHCLGYATSNNIEGPFVDNSAQPWICPVKQGGAIDISGFYDTKKHKRYVVYKVDGNAIGHGGECGNTIKPIVPHTASRCEQWLQHDRNCTQDSLQRRRGSRRSIRRSTCA
jgi:beta-xylosidase